MKNMNELLFLYVEIFTWDFLLNDKKNVRVIDELPFFYAI